MTWSYRQARFRPSDRAIVRDSFLYAAPDDAGVRMFSVYPHASESSQYLTALSVSDGLNAKVSSRLPEFPGSTTEDRLYDTEGILISLSICSLSDSPLPEDATFLSYSIYSEGPGETTRVIGFKDPDFASAWSRVVIDGAAGWRRISNVATLNDVGGQPALHTTGVVDGSGAAYDRVVYRPVDASNGDMVQEITFVSGGTPAARSFQWRGKAYLPVVVQEQLDGGASNLHGGLFWLAETNGFEPWICPLVGNWSVSRYATFSRFEANPLNPPIGVTLSDGEAILFASPSKANVYQTQIDRITISPIGATLPLPPAQAQGLAYLPGGLTSVFDGQRVFEAGFLARPVLTREEGSTEAPGIPAGTYLYLAEWEHFDAKGNRHVSAPSPVLSVEVV